MVTPPACRLIALLLSLCLSTLATAQDGDFGSIRGVVYDKDFEIPMPGATVRVQQTGASVESADNGTYLIPNVKPGTYTLVFSKTGFVQVVEADVVVVAGALTDQDAWLSGDFTDLEEYIVEEIEIGSGEEAILELRDIAPQLVDAISSELMSQAGASDAASALTLISGTTVSDGKFAVIRGLPDRYVNSQLNGIRLPTADEDKRAVQLDQFPSAVIREIVVSKTFLPDQQGDASGGAVNVLLKGIPEKTELTFKAQMSYNSQVGGNSNFLTYNGGGLNLLGKSKGRAERPGDTRDLDIPVGVTRGEAPIDFKWSIAGGSRHEFDNGVTIGGFASFFYERDSSFHSNGIDDSYWVTTPGGAMVPRTKQGTPQDGDFKTSLFNVTEGSELVQWGTLGTLGMESENNRLGVTFLYTRTSEDTAILAEDTRGKEYFFPGYDLNDEFDEGNEPGNLDAAPYLRTETLNYSERTTQTLQFHGWHRLPIGEVNLSNLLRFRNAEIDWMVASSSATSFEPDKRQFGSLWRGESYNPGFPPFIPPFTMPAEYRPFKPAANFTLGNFQRIWKNIEEESNQRAINLTLPFEQWNGLEGYVKAGFFDDTVVRTFNQDTYSNFNDNAGKEGHWEDFWSAVWPYDDHVVTDGPPFVDVDYRGTQDITAYYGMAELPISDYLTVIGGFREEKTELGIVNSPEEDATWFPPGAIAPVTLQPGDADVNFAQSDFLPALSLILTPIEHVTVRASYTQTIARQTYKELTPIQQQEFLGGDIFIGNPNLKMSSLTNIDLRVDYEPARGVLFSASWFDKDIENPIEYVQRVAGFTFTTPVNYPNGRLRGLEFEVRQNLGAYFEGLDGIDLGANATFISSEVLLPADERAGFDLPNILAPMTTRDMTGAPERLYNIYVTWNSVVTGTKVALFYTVKGDTLIAGAGQSDGNFVPSIYATEYDTLNLSVSQKLGEFLSLRLQVKNLTNPHIQEVYRSRYIGADVLHTSYTKGIDYSIGLSATIPF